MTVESFLRGINAYPIPATALERIALRRGFVLSETLVNAHDEFARLAEADVWWWLAFAPNVAQGGQNYSFTDEQRDQFKAWAQAVYDEFGTKDGDAVTYGYKGTRL